MDEYEKNNLEEFEESNKDDDAHVGEKIISALTRGVLDFIHGNAEEKRKRSYENRIRFDNFSTKMEEYYSAFKGETKVQAKTIKLVIDYIVDCAVDVLKKEKIKKKQSETKDIYEQRREAIRYQFKLDVKDTIDKYLKDNIGDNQHKYIVELNKRFKGGYFKDGVYKSVDLKSLLNEINRKYRDKYPSLIEWLKK